MTGSANYDFELVRSLVFVFPFFPNLYAVLTVFFFFLVAVVLVYFAQE